MNRFTMLAYAAVLAVLLAGCGGKEPPGLKLSSVVWDVGETGKVGAGGYVRNNSAETYTWDELDDIGLRVKFLDREGQVIATGTGVIGGLGFRAEERERLTSAGKARLVPGDSLFFTARAEMLDARVAAIELFIGEGADAIPVANNKRKLDGTNRVKSR